MYTKFCEGKSFPEGFWSVMSWNSTILLSRDKLHFKGGLQMLLSDAALCWKHKRGLAVLGPPNTLG